jgi:large subunit ribosomal protein L10
MKKKADKQKDIEALRAALSAGPHIFLTGYERLTVKQDFELRKVVRGTGASYRVVKNNLVEKATEGTAAESLMKGLRGMNSIAYTTADPVSLAKALTAYAKANPSFTFRAGMVEGRVVAAKAIQEIASLPAREELLSKLLFLIQAPAQRLATAIHAVGRNLAVVVDQACQENKFRSEEI